MCALALSAWTEENGGKHGQEKEGKGVRRCGTEGWKVKAGQDTGVARRKRLPQKVLLATKVDALLLRTLTSKEDSEENFCVINANTRSLGWQ